MNGIKKALKICTCLALVISIVTLTAMLAVFSYAKSKIDFSIDERLFEGGKGSSITRLYANSSYNTKEYIPQEIAVISPYEGKKLWYSYSEIGDNVKLAFISAEDRSFFSHKGVDVKRTGFAILNYFLKIKPKFGGSTITQQVIKNISGDDEQTAKRKINEIIRATHIEYTHSKEEIFELYMNIVPMGDGISGIGLASEYYFGKSPSELTTAEAATLVGITNAPTKYNPRVNPEACLEKRNRVLYAMKECRAISEAEYNNSIIEPLNTISKSECYDSVYSWFIETVYDEVITDLAREKSITKAAARLLLSSGGFSIYTTENIKVQAILEAYFENISNFPAATADGLDYAMAVCDSKTGDLIGIVGGIGRKSGNKIINQATVPHIPGSVLKPLALYSPLLNKKRVNWATVLEDSPIKLIERSDGSLTPYPRNSPDVYNGPITLSDALRLSKNTIAARLYEMSDSREIFKLLRNSYHLESLVEREESKEGRLLTDIALAPLALGQLTYGTSLRSLTEAFTVFPSEGVKSSSRSYLCVIDEDGEVFLDKRKTGERILTTECARIMNQMLMQVTESGTAKRITLGSIIDTAGKTGTSGMDKDRLFVGYTPYFTAGIWCGYKTVSKSIGRTEISHLDIWDSIMKEIHESMLGKSENIDSFSTDGLLYLPYFKETGELYDGSGEAHQVEYGYFTKDNLPEKREELFEE